MAQKVTPYGGCKYEYTLESKNDRRRKVMIHLEVPVYASYV